MLAWIVTSFYVLGVIAAVDSIMHTRTATGAIAWSVSLVTVPFIALPAYLVFGRSKFAGMEDAFAHNKQEIDVLSQQIRKNLHPWNAASDVQSGHYQAIRRLSGMDLVRGNRVDLLNNGQATFDSILSGISQARQYVLVQFYMFHDDGLGRRMKEAMIERARDRKSTRLNSSHT